MSSDWPLENSCKLALDRCPKSILITDSAGKILYVNSQLCSMTGYMGSELLGNNPGIMQSGLTPPEVYRGLWDTITSGNVWNGELRNRKKGGELYWEAISIAPICNAQAEPVMFIAVKDDISARKELEAELNLMAETLRNSHDFVGACRPDLTPFFLNDAGRRMIGLENGNPLPPTLDIFWKDDIRLIQNEVIPALLEKGCWTGEVRLKNFKTGMPVYTLGKSFVVYDDDDRPLAWATSNADISALKETQMALEKANLALEQKLANQTEQLRYSENILRTAFQLSPDAMVITRLEDGAYLDVNPGFARITGYSHEEAIGRTSLSLDLWVNKEEREQLFALFQDSGEVRDFEARFRRKDGRLVFGLLYARRIDVGGSPCILTFTRDITERKLAEQKFAALRDKQADMATELSLLDEQIRQSVSAELHDQIGQSLALARIKLSSMDRNLLPVTATKLLDGVQNILEDVIHDVRSLTLQLFPPILASSGLESALAWLCRQMGEDYGMKFFFEDDRQAKPVSGVLRSVTYQSARELMINAVKHAQATEIRVSVSREGNNLILAVQDNGTGFDVEAILTSPKDGCFGLFNIGRQIRHLGGMISAFIPPDGGSLLRMSVPLQEQ